MTWKERHRLSCNSHLLSHPHLVNTTDKVNMADADIATKSPECDAQEDAVIPGDSKVDQRAASMGVRSLCSLESKAAAEHV